MVAACVDGGTERHQVGLLEAPVDGAGLQLSLHAPPGLSEEGPRCHLVVLPAGGGEGIDVEAIEHRLTDGARTLRLSHTDLTIEDAVANAGLVMCDDVADHAGPVVYSSEEEAAGVTLPTGVALHFAPTEVVLLEVGFADEAGAAGDEARVNLWFSTSDPDERTDVLPAARPAAHE
jgi:hypothetical protein